MNRLMRCVLMSMYVSTLPRLLGSRGDSSWSIRRRGLLEISLKADPHTPGAEHEKLGDISSHKCNIVELCIYNIISVDFLLVPFRQLQLMIKKNDNVLGSRLFLIVLCILPSLYIYNIIQFLYKLCSVTPIGKGQLWVCSMKLGLLHLFYTTIRWCTQVFKIWVNPRKKTIHYFSIANSKFCLSVFFFI